MSLRDVAREFALTQSKTFAHDRRLTVGASEIAKCMRRVKYGKLETPVDEGYVDANGFATRGNIMEDAWSAPLVEHWVTRAGGKLLWAGQANQQTFVGKGVPISATPDGLAINLPPDFLKEHGVPDLGPAGSLVTELKSISPRYSKHKLPKPEHPWQTMVQMGMIREATEYKPDFGAVIYVEADDFWNVHAFPVKWDEAQFKSLVKRADHLMKTNDPNALPPEGKMRGGSECSECPFARRCLGYRPYVHDEDPKAMTKTQVQSVEKIAKKLHEAEVKEEAAKRARLALEGDLYLRLGEVKRSFVQGSKFKVHAKKTPAQNRTDAKKLVALALSKGATAAEIEACKSPTKEGTSLSVEMV